MIANEQAFDLASGAAAMRFPPPHAGIHTQACDEFARQYLATPFSNPRRHIHIVTSTSSLARSHAFDCARRKTTRMKPPKPRPIAMTTAIVGAPKSNVLR